uniref:Anaphase-promoting complex subunit 13 n=1 Tax=Sarcoptes scabiei TaxID=52283 RepID=A0A834RF24_SARSC
MDSDLIRNGRLTFLVDANWREDVSKLPNEDVYVSNMHLPDPEPENNASKETLKELDLKWRTAFSSSITIKASGLNETSVDTFPTNDEPSLPVRPDRWM